MALGLLSVHSQCFVPSVSCQKTQGESKEKTSTVLPIISSSPGTQLGPGGQWANGSMLKTASCPRQTILEGDKGPENGDAHISLSSQTARMGRSWEYADNLVVWGLSTQS